MTTTRVVLIGGPYDRQRSELTATPSTIRIGSALYDRIDDPDTGESLGGYVCRTHDTPAAEG